MSLWDFLKRNKKDAFQQYADNMQPLQLVQATPNAEGGVDAQVTEWKPKPTKAQQLKTRLADALLGDRMQATDNIGKGDGLPVTLTDEITGQEVTYAPQNVSTISENPRVGGLFNDIMNGAKENFATGFAVPNLFDDTTSDGRNKGFAYRLGEGLGTAGRFLESAPGRALLTAGAVGLAGGNGADMLAYGIQGGALNQQLRSADKLYREQLKDNYGFTDEQLNNTRGYIRPDTFNNLTKSQNSAMNLAIRQQASQSMNNLRALQAEKLRIMNSTLPEMQKAKLLQENAKAAHAEEMQLARINYYNNAIANPLGWANLGLRTDKFNYDKAKDAQEAANEQAIIDSLGGGSTPPAMPKGGTTKSGNKWKEVN
jgi:hypothetical protein